MDSLQDFENSDSHPSTALAPTATTTNTNPSAANSSASASSPSSSSTLSRYESQKRRDWNTFSQYLRNHRPPISLSRCNGALVLDFLRYLDQFGKTKVHTKICPFFGHPNPPAPCPCPLRQAWGSLDALIGRLRAAFEEHGGKTEANPFGARAVRLYLSEVRDYQAKARGIGYVRKRRKRPPQGPPPLPPPEKMMDAQPRTNIALWKANLEEPKLNQPEPSVAILDNTTISRRTRRRRGIYTCPEARCKPGISRCNHETRIKLASGNENDRQQLQRSCDACKGIPQATGPAFLHTSQPPAAQATAPPHAEDLELAMAINASIQTAVAETTNFHLHSGNEASSSSSEWTMTEAGSGSNSTEGTQIDNNNVSAAHTTVQTSDSAPSAPPAMDEIIEDGPIQYPLIDSSPIDLPSSNVEKQPDSAPQTKEDGSPTSCAICLDAPSEAACVPCGHVAGCMSCLNEIKAKKWGCPVCRAKIELVLKLYRV